MNFPHCVFLATDNLIFHVLIFTNSLFCIIGKYTCVGDVASNSNGGGQSRYAVPPEPRTILDSKEAKFQGPSEC